MSSGWREKDGGQAATQMPHIACQDILGHPAKVWAGDRQPWTENLPDKTERLGEARRPWTPAVSGVISPGRPTLIPYLFPYSCQGGRRTQRELSHGTILEKEAWVGGRKENTGEMVRSLSRCNAPFLPGLQSFPVWSFKSRECLGAKLLLLGSGWHLPLASNGGPILVWYTLGHVISAPHKAWP